MSRPTSGMTFIEVLACLLILVAGMTGAIAVVRHGMRLGEESIAANLALPTARSLLADVRPSGPAVLDLATTGNVTQGHVNGLFVRRTVLDRSTTGSTTFATVRVEVFWSGAGQRSLMIQERMVFHAE